MSDGSQMYFVYYFQIITVLFISSPLSIASFFIFVTASTAEEFRLELPLNCENTNACFIQNFFDHQIGLGAKDFECGPKTYDTHKGTDFAIFPDGFGYKNSEVLAAASGQVAAIRNSVEDGEFIFGDKKNIAGIECGNGVVISHADGWQTQYCHLQDGSIDLVKGQQVLAGQVIGLIGLSGKTQFPHLHFSVRKDGNYIDPFSKKHESLDCDKENEHIWVKLPNLKSTGLLEIGFTDSVPEIRNLRFKRNINKLTREASELVVYIYGFNTKPLDNLRIKVLGPKDFTFERQLSFKKFQAQSLSFIGVNLQTPLSSGLYSVNAYLLREKNLIDKRLHSIFVE